jgi:NAD(P)-dependent dehydrogenase (short-subunit alcohol dehydrogenase family)
MRAHKIGFGSTCLGFARILHIRIVNITSLGGRISFSLNSPYHASKFALEGLSESVAYELEPFGIKFMIIEPGGVGSNFLKI